MNWGRFFVTAAALCSPLLLVGCASWSEPSRSTDTLQETLQNAALSDSGFPAESRIIGQQLLIDPGQHLLLELPRQEVTVLARQTVETPQHTLETRDLPWANQPVRIRVNNQERIMLRTDERGVLLLDLLSAPLVQVDVLNARSIKLKAESKDATTGKLVLPVSPGLRARLHEIRNLMYEDLESGDVPHWVTRIARLNELGLKAEAQNLEATLVKLSSNDPELYQELMNALQKMREQQAP